MSLKLYHKYKKHILHFELVWGNIGSAATGRMRVQFRCPERGTTLLDRTGQMRGNEGARGREREEAGEIVQSLLTLCSEHLKRHRRGAVMKQQLSAQHGPAAGRKWNPDNISDHLPLMHMQMQGPVNCALPSSGPAELKRGETRQLGEICLRSPSLRSSILHSIFVLTDHSGQTRRLEPQLGL